MWIELIRGVNRWIYDYCGEVISGEKMRRVKRFGSMESRDI